MTTENAKIPEVPLGMSNQFNENINPRMTHLDLNQESNQLLSKYHSAIGLNCPSSLLHLSEESWNIDKVIEFLSSSPSELFQCDDKTFCFDKSLSESIHLNCGHFICKTCLMNYLSASLVTIETFLNLKCKICEHPINKRLFFCSFPKTEFVLSYHQLLIATSSLPTKIVFFTMKGPDGLKCFKCGFPAHPESTCKEQERLNQLTAQQELKCDFHSNSQAIRFNLNEKLLLCEQCRGQSGDFYLSLSTSNFSKVLKAKILCSFFVSQRPERQSYLDIGDLSLENLIQFYKNTGRDFINSPIFMSSSRCEKCRVPFEISNPPYFFSSALVCESCRLLCVGPKIILDDSTIISNPNQVPFISPINLIPSCPSCKQQFNLKDHFPREFSCGHVICQFCLNRANPHPHFQPICPNSECADSISSLGSSTFLIQAIRRTQIMCTRHKGQSATHLEEVSLKSFCSKCLMFSQGNKLELSQPSLRLFHFLTETILSRGIGKGMSREAFEELSFQEMLDEIRSLKDPDNRDSLNSFIPKGRTLDDRVGKDCSLIRFFTVMPSAERNPNYALVTKAWVVSAGQVEAVSFWVDRQVVLTGMVFGEKQSIGRAYVEKVKILKGNFLNVDGDDLLDLKKELLGNGLAQIVLFRPVPLIAGEIYSLVVSVIGDDVTLVRGNPLDLKEDLIGTDGTRFFFSEPVDPGEYKINGQHDISGPILGLIYRKLL
jgi:hypothetical protein